MKREAFESQRYYVFGAGADDTDLTYIGLCTRPPEEMPVEIFKTIAQSANETLRMWAARVLEGGSPSVFQIQECATPLEADEAVNCWTQYFRFLGMPLIEQRFSPEPQASAQLSQPALAS